MKKGADTGEMLNDTNKGPDNAPPSENVFPVDVNTVHIDPGVKVLDEDVTMVIVCPGTKDAFGTVIWLPTEL
jgi:hypothetical protein